MEIANKPRSGIVLLDKPEGITSQTAVVKVRNILRAKYAGHTGTLDPIATGLMVICYGRATRAVEYLTGCDKAYEAVLKTGIATDTCDITGKTIFSSEIKPSAAQIRAILPKFLGRQRQRPPIFSAIRVNGRHLYDLARSGKDFVPEKREVFIESIELLSADEGKGLFRLAVSCSKGTYIRALCRDIGEAAGCGGTMAALRRTKVGRYKIDDALTLEAMAERTAAGDYGFVMGTDSVFDGLSKIKIDGEAVRMIKNGAAVPESHIICGGAVEGERLRVYSPEGDFVAVCVYAGGALSCEKSFFEV
jgi:tRNA pseudouridine55 synthase